MLKSSYKIILSKFESVPKFYPGIRFFIIHTYVRLNYNLFSFGNVVFTVKKGHTENYEVGFETSVKNESREVSLLFGVFSMLCPATG